jgi:hypothetical protein
MTGLGKNIEKLEPLYMAREDVGLYSYFRKQFDCSWGVTQM